MNRAAQRSVQGDLLDAFFRDGSLRDVPVDGTRSQLEVFAMRLVEAGWSLSVEAAAIDCVDWSRWLPVDGSLCLTASRDGCDLHLWAWSPAVPDGFFSEMDLDPTQVNRDNIDVIAGALGELADILERPVHLIVENVFDAILAVAEPGGDITVDQEACSSWAEPTSCRK